MRPTHDAIAAISTVILLVIAGRTTVAQNRSEFRDWTPSALADATRVKPRVGCSSLLSQTGYDLSITSATTIPATTELPEYCRIVGLIQPEIRFEVNLPTSWNGRLYIATNTITFSEGCTFFGGCRVYWYASVSTRKSGYCL